MPVYVPIASVMSKAYAVKPNASPLWVIKMLLRIKIKRLYPSGEYRSCLADISWGILLMSGAQG